MRVSASSLRQIPTVECGFQPLPQKMSGVLTELNGRKIKIPKEDSVKPSLNAISQHYQSFLQNCWEEIHEQQVVEHLSEKNGR